MVKNGRENFNFLETGKNFYAHCTVNYWQSSADSWTKQIHLKAKMIPCSGFAWKNVLLRSVLYLFPVLL